MPQCPFCFTELHEQASVCPQCNAQKGIATANGYVHTYKSLLSVSLGCLAVGLFLGLVVGDVAWIMASLFLIGALAGFIAMAVAKVRGERWYR